MTRRHRRIRLNLALFGFFALLLGLSLSWHGPGQAEASVILAGPIEAKSVEDGIQINWATGSEIDLSAFFLLRLSITDGETEFQPVPICVRDDKDGGNISRAIISQGDVAGFNYQITDLAVDLDAENAASVDLVAGKTYAYLLVEQGLNGEFVALLDDIVTVSYSFVGGGPTIPDRGCQPGVALPIESPPQPTATPTKANVFLPDVNR
jgi:hypothetical protein